MKKTLASLGLATALLVTSGAAVVAAQDDASDTTPTTVLTAERVRDCDLDGRDTFRLRDHDRDSDTMPFRVRREWFADADPCPGSAEDEFGP